MAVAAGQPRRRTALMASQLETISPRAGSSYTSRTSESLFRSVTFAATQTSTPGWFVRRSHNSRARHDRQCRGPRRDQTALRGPADAPSSATTATPKSAAPQKPLRSAGPSIQECGLDPREGGRSGSGRAAGESRPPADVAPGRTASAPVRGRFGRRAAAVVASVTPHCHRGPAWVPIQASGSGPVPQPGFAGSSPSSCPVVRGRPLSPQFGGRFPKPVRWFRNVRVRSCFSLQGGFETWAVTTGCH